MDINIKVIDEYKSKRHKGKLLTEFIVYMSIDGQQIKAYTVIGDENMNSLVESLKISNDISNIIFNKTTI